jgi:thiamine kinase-like enzyme
METDLPQINKVLKKLTADTSCIKMERMGGMTNHSYHVLMDNGENLAVRLPGDGTEKLICRPDEKVSTELACSLDIDSDLLYFGEDGTKVSKYIEDAVTMSPESLRKKENILQAAGILKALHTCGADTKVPFEVFDMAANYEKIVMGNKVPLYMDYPNIKSKVMEIKDSIDRLTGVKKVPCHNDPLCENWVMGKDGLYLIDWEYAGMNDGMWDLADVSIEASYNEVQDRALLNAYFGRQETLDEKRRFLANKIYLDYLWTLWGLTRVFFDGEVMQSYADKRYVRLKTNLLKWKDAEE